MHRFIITLTFIGLSYSMAVEANEQLTKQKKALCENFFQFFGEYTELGYELAKMDKYQAAQKQSLTQAPQKAWSELIQYPAPLKQRFEKMLAHVKKLTQNFSRETEAYCIKNMDSSWVIKYLNFKRGLGVTIVDYYNLFYLHLAALLLDRGIELPSLKVYMSIWLPEKLDFVFKVAEQFPGFEQQLPFTAEAVFFHGYNSHCHRALLLQKQLDKKAGKKNTDNKSLLNGLQDKNTAILSSCCSAKVRQSAESEWPKANDEAMCLSKEHNPLEQAHQRESVLLRDHKENEAY